MVRKSKLKLYESKLIPWGDRVLIKDIEENEEGEERTESGIIIPKTATQENKGSRIGEIVEVGTGRREGNGLVPLEFKKGQRVVYTRYGYDEVTVDGKQLYLVEEKDVLAIINLPEEGEE